MTDEAIVLAGGLGTRLREVVKDVPKPMAEVNGQPFLDYILDYLIKNKITKVILAVGYKHEIIREYLSQNKKFSDLHITYSIENEPLGTGGAIAQAIAKVDGPYTFIVNGDTFFDISLNQLENFAHKKNAEIAIALKELPFSNRYGQVAYSSDDRILSFSENKQDQRENCIINGGTYFINKKIFEPFDLPQKFSLENDFFKPYLKNIQAYGKGFKDFFIDIGIPEDYNLAQKIFEGGSIKKRYDTLFLDRDGVLNKKIDNGYVLKEGDIQILSGISKFLEFAKSHFSRILVMTNQRCIGRGIISYAEVIKLNEKINRKTGSFIDYFYVCPHLNKDDCVCRKPKTGLFFYALEDYPIDFKNSWMIGDSVTDLIPAKELGIKTILISSEGNSIADIHIESTKDLLSLPEWASFNREKNSSGNL